MLPTKGSAENIRDHIISYIHVRSIFTEIGKNINIRHSYFISIKLPGLQSVRREQTERSTFETVKAGLQLSFRMSKQITPWLFMLQ